MKLSTSGDPLFIYHYLFCVDTSKCIKNTVTITWAGIINIHYKSKLVALPLPPVCGYVWFLIFIFSHLCNIWLGLSIPTFIPWLCGYPSDALASFDSPKKCILGDFKIASKCDCECLWLFHL